MAEFKYRPRPAVRRGNTLASKRATEARQRREAQKWEGDLPTGVIPVPEGFIGMIWWQGKRLKTQPFPTPDLARQARAALIARMERT